MLGREGGRKTYPEKEKSGEWDVGGEGTLERNCYASFLRNRT